MKRTTYMMLGAFICGLLLVSAFSFEGVAEPHLD